MRDSFIVFAGLMPHAPVLVPGVGGKHVVQVRRTIAAMTKLAEHLVAARPDTVLVLSPHSPRRTGAFALWRMPQLHGSFARFGSPADRVDLPLDRRFAERLEQEAKGLGLKAWPIVDEELDHGATVPLFYLQAAGWNGPTVVVGLGDPGDQGRDELGRAIAATAQALHRQVALIASGDMSHRLTPSAPCGYHPEASRFDHAFINLLRKGDAIDLTRLDPGLQETAAEDVVDSTLVALAATAHATDGHELLNYEGPFGVGYGVAILFEPDQAGTEPPPAGAKAREKHAAGRILSTGEDLLKVARAAVAAGPDRESAPPPFTATGELAARRGVFVTLRTADGQLRGCVGTSEPQAADLVRETWHSAMAAAFRDPRFSPVRAEELPRLHFEVTILDRLEQVASPRQLDPAEYGIVVTADDGRHALLLPAIKGIDSVAQQLQVVRAKAGIGPDEPVGMQRFRARKFVEPGSPEPGE